MVSGSPVDAKDSWMSGESAAMAAQPLHIEKQAGVQSAIFPALDGVSTVVVKPDRHAETSSKLFLIQGTLPSINETLTVVRKG